MRVLREGHANEQYVWEHTCDYCDSDIRIIEGDPRASRLFYNSDRQQYWIRYICPVCGSQNIAMTASAFGTPEANATREKVVLSKEDRKDMDTWEETKIEAVSMDDLEFLTDASAP